MEQVDLAQADRTDRVAVVGSRQTHEQVPHRSPRTTLARLPVVLPGNLQRHFHRRRTTVAIKHVVQPGRSHLDQPTSQLDRQVAAEAE